MILQSIQVTKHLLIQKHLLGPWRVVNRVLTPYDKGKAIGKLQGTRLNATKCLVFLC